EPLSTIGKGPENTIVITDTAISRRHAAIELREGRYLIKDLGSLNGLFVNSLRIGEHGRMLLDGDQIELGRTRITFYGSAAALPQTSPAELKARKADPYKTEVSPQFQLPPQPEQRVVPPPPPKAPQLNFRVAATGELLPLVPRAHAPAEPIVLDDRYELLEKIIEDPNGTLYRARRKMLGDLVCVRVLRPELIHNEIALERFRRQAIVAARIKHPNSVQVLDFGYIPARAAYIVEEQLSGRTLRDLLKAERGLSLARIVNIFSQVCGAVHTAHLNGIVLRDLKPESIYVEKGEGGKELIKVGGYGLAKLDEGSQGKALTGPFGVLGSPYYMSPDQWLNRKLDARSDVYSLGVILFELLTGAPPYTAAIPMEIAELHISSPVPDITEFGRGELDEGISAVVSRALAKEPSQRQSSALQLAEELQAVSGVGEGIGTRLAKRTRILAAAPVVVPQPVALAAGEVALPSVLPEVKEKGRGAFNAIVMALMAEAFLSRLSGGLLKITVPLYALLVFGLDLTTVIFLEFIQNIVAVVLKPGFGILADRYGKKHVFMVSLSVKVLVGLLYVIANKPLLFAISMVQGLADSAKGPSTSAIIADNTDEKNIAKAYSWYTTTKSTSGGIGEFVASFFLVGLLIWFAGTRTVTAHFAVLEKTTSTGKVVEKEIVKDPAAHPVGSTMPGAGVDRATRLVIGHEQREMTLKDVPIDDLSNVVDNSLLRKALVVLFLATSGLSFSSLILVAFFIKEKSKEKKKDKDKKAKKDKPESAQPEGQKQPSVWAFALLGTALTAPGYMVTGRFFLLLASKFKVTLVALAWIKFAAETVIPLIFGPFFGWLADRIGTKKVIALRSLANLLTSVLFWVMPKFAGTALLGVMMGIARGVDEIGKASFKPTWGAVAAKVSSFNLARRGRTMGIMETGVDVSEMAFPVIAVTIFQKFWLGPLMLVRGLLALLAEVYAHLLMRKSKL
ncbi:MAG: MFS transporter, partial [Acidobacteria bacterium]|nr:MFS transporter [Acidobacteriota bacterium]